MSVCRLMILAFQGHDNFGYDKDDLTNGIAWAEGLLMSGFKKDPLDDLDLEEFIAWAKERHDNWTGSGVG